jgi:hypothetical protein
MALFWVYAPFIDLKGAGVSKERTASIVTVTDFVRRWRRHVSSKRRDMLLLLCAKPQKDDSHLINYCPWKPFMFFIPEEERYAVYSCSPYIVKVMNWRWQRWVGHVIRVRETWSSDATRQTGRIWRIILKLSPFLGKVSVRCRLD